MVDEIVLSFAWGPWDGIRVVNILLCIGIVALLIIRARRWIHAEPADRVLMLGLGWFGIATAWGAIEASLQGVHGGSRVALYTLASALALAGIVLPRKGTTTMTITTEPEAKKEPRRTGEVAKFIVPALVAVAVLLKPLFEEGVVWTPLLILSVVVAFANAPVVYYLGGTRAKTIATAVAAGLQVLLAIIDSAFQWSDFGSVTYETWVTAGLAVAAIFGVAKIPNAPPVVPVEPVMPMIPVEAPGGRLDMEDALEKQDRLVEIAKERRGQDTAPTRTVE